MYCPICNKELAEFNLICPECRTNVTTLVKVAKVRQELQELREHMITGVNHLSDSLAKLDNEISEEIKRRSNDSISELASIAAGEVLKPKIESPTHVATSTKKNFDKKNFLCIILIACVLVMILTCLLK